MKHNLITKTEKTMTQDEVYEIDLIKDLIVLGNYSEAFSLATKFNSQGDTLKIEKLVLFKIDDVCKILRVRHQTMSTYIQTDQIQTIITDDSRCYISLESLLKYVEDFI